MDKYWLERPSVAFHYAFDHIAENMANSDGRILCLMSSPFLASELIRRIAGNIIFCPIPPWNLNHFNDQSTLTPEIFNKYLQLLSLTEIKDISNLDAIIWAEPSTLNWQDILDEVSPLLSQGLKINIFGTTRIRKILPEYQSGRLFDNDQPVNINRILKVLHEKGIEVQEIKGYHGPLSILFGILTRIPGSVGRTDLVDRLIVAMRRHYLASGWQAKFSPVWLLTASSQTDKS